MWRMGIALATTLVLLAVCAAVFAGPWKKLAEPILTSDGRVFSYEFYDNRIATGGGSAQTDAIKGVVTSITYG